MENYRNKRTSRYETYESAAIRYGVKKEDIEKGFRDGDLFWTENPRKPGMRDVGGVVKEMFRERKDEREERGMAERVILLVVFIMLGLGIPAVVGSVWFLFAGIGFGIANMFVKKREPQERVVTKYVGVSDGGGGGSLFGWDAPSSAAKADFDWMFGKNG